MYDTKPNQKVYRLANEGVTQRNNDVTLTPDELNFADVLFQGLGLPTTKLTEQQFRTGVNIETKEFFSKLTTELKRDYSKAYRDNDRPALEAIRQRWKIVQDKRVARGLKRQPLSELLKSKNLTKSPLPLLARLDKKTQTGNLTRSFALCVLLSHRFQFPL